MKILATTQIALDGAAAKQSVTVARGLVRLGHEVILAAPGHESDTIPGVLRLRPRIHFEPGLRLESALFEVASRYALIKHPTIAYCRLSASSSLVPLGLAKMGTPVVVELNGTILSDLRAQGRSRERVAAVRMSLRKVVEKARALIATHETTAAHARDELGATRVHLIDFAIESGSSDGPIHTLAEILKKCASSS